VFPRDFGCRARPGGRRHGEIMSRAAQNLGGFRQGPASPQSARVAIVDENGLFIAGDDDSPDSIKL
jgi:hypothetical protein